MHDSRLDPGYAIAYECEPTPGRHTISCYLYAGLFGVQHSFPAADQMIKKTKGRTAKKVRQYAAGSFFMQLVNCAGMCMFGAMISRLPLVDYFNAVTGWDLSVADVLTTGARIQTLRQCFNVREGLQPSDIKLPGRMTGRPPQKEGPVADVNLDVDNLAHEYRQAMGWDPTTGRAEESTLKKLGLTRLIKSHG